MIGITNHKILVAVFKKDVVTLSQHLQHILLRIHQYKVYILYTPGPDLYITDWLSRQNYIVNKEKEKGMKLSITVISMMTGILSCQSLRYKKLDRVLHIL